MQFHDSAHERETDAESIARTVVTPPERFKYTPQIRSGYSLTRILDGDLRRCLTGRQRNRDGAARSGIANRIRQQVRKRLLQTSGIAEHRDRGVRERANQVHTSAPRQRVDRVHRLLEATAQVHGRALDPNFNPDIALPLFMDVVRHVLGGKSGNATAGEKK